MMRRTIWEFVPVLALVLATGAQAQPFAATYTGFIFGTADPFTAVFRYDTSDLVADPGNMDYADAKPGTLQTATYTDPFRTLTFTSPSFSKGEYTSEVLDQDGNVVETDTVHAFSLFTADGLLSLQFGGADDGGIVTFDNSGSDYVSLDPRSFALTKDIVSPVPLPSSLSLLGSALVLIGALGLARTRRLSASA